MANERSWPTARGTLADSPRTRSSPTQIDEAPLTWRRTKRAVTAPRPGLGIQLGAPVATVSEGPMASKDCGELPTHTSTMPLAAAPARLMPKPETLAARPRSIVSVAGIDVGHHAVAALP